MPEGVKRLCGSVCYDGRICQSPCRPGKDICKYCDPETSCNFVYADGRKCRKLHLTGRPKCKGHDGGGSTKMGTKNPNYKHGLKSKANRDIDRRYKLAMDDPELMTLRKETAMLKARINQLWEGIESDAEDYQQAWQDIKSTVEEFNAARKLPGKSGTPRMVAAIDKLTLLISEGPKQIGDWDELVNRLLDVQKLVESEWRRSYAKQYVMSITQGRTLVDQMFFALMNTLKEHVKPATAALIMTKIGDAMASMMGGYDDRPVPKPLKLPDQLGK